MMSVKKISSMCAGCPRGGVATILSLSVLALLFVATSARTLDAASPACTAQIPRNVKDFIRTKYASWSVTDLSDLPPDDRALFERAIPNTCPGFVPGRFKEGSQHSYAAMLIKSRSNKIQQRLIVVEATNGLRTETLWDKQWPKVEGGRVLIVRRIPPGTHWAADRSAKIETTLDSIALEALEAGVTLFYWKDGRFRSIDIQI